MMEKTAIKQNDLIIDRFKKELQTVIDMVDRYDINGRVVNEFTIDSFEDKEVSITIDIKKELK